MFDFFKKKTPSKDLDHYAMALAALEHGDLEEAQAFLMAEIERNPKNIQAHLHVGRSMTQMKKYPQAINVYSSLVLYPDIRGHAELPHEEIDSLFVETLLKWAAEIEASGFPEQHLALFGRAVDFYTGPQFSGTRTVALVGLDEGLRRNIAVTETFAEIIRSKNK